MLGFLLGYIFIKIYNVENNIYADEIVLLMIIPGLDMFRVFLERIISKKNPFHADRKHIHHILIKKFSLLNTNIILFLMNILPILIYNYLQGYFILILICLILSYSFIILSNEK